MDYTLHYSGHTVTNGFRSQMARKAESASVSWRHHEKYHSYKLPAGDDIMEIYPAQIH